MKSSDWFGVGVFVVLTVGIAAFLIPVLVTNLELASPGPLTATYGGPIEFISPLLALPILLVAVGILVAVLR
ncbi:MAG: hypothetical protein WC766_06280 [Patescibacteria group bacterium]|jgi:hypothetical protein